MNRITFPLCSHDIRLLRSFFPTAHASTVRRRTVYAGNKVAKRSRSRLAMDGHGDLNNSHAAREVLELAVDPADRYRSFAIETHEDDTAVRHLYRPFLLPEPFAADDWVAQLELDTGLKMVESEILGRKRDRVRILVLYGSLRSRYVIASPVFWSTNNRNSCSWHLATRVVGRVSQTLKLTLI